MDIAKVTSKGQVTIPKSVRDDLDLQPGSKLLFVKSGASWRVISTDQVRNTNPEPSSTMSTGERNRILRELAAKYDLNPPEIQNEASRPIDEIIDDLQRGFEGVAKESGWETEQDVVDYIKAMRRGELD